ncbi:RNA-binding region-containing protein 3 isoform X1 [Mastacembelus armatus]|uniref:RNA-binding region-containing protein 3 isoform X1 n=1 Tax=Mastacembelus armatus TaxID=205130 RepID=UPI000E45D95E|nr:RNA-binding region-containing protein 3 isoform X1 [Mastacembelus armatus]
MDKHEDVVQANGTTTLLIRHLPAELSPQEKEDLLKYFGAESVRVFLNPGHLKHAAFATFASEKSAARALSRLHQLPVLDRTLVVEFSRGHNHVGVLKDPPVSSSGKCKEEQRKPQIKQANIPPVESGIAPGLGLKFELNPTLKYLYPPPSNSILTNIAHTLISVPKFYVQVLHLMNKMNLPCPFGPVTSRPLLTYEVLPPAPHIPMPPPFPPDYPPLPEEEMELSSEEESEYESGDDEDKERIVRLMGLVNQACKRPMRPKTVSKRKKPKIKDLLYAPKADSQSTAVLLPCDVFEQPHPTGPRKIEFQILVPEGRTTVDKRGPEQEAPSEGGRDEKVVAPSVRNETEVTEGFGKLYPSVHVSPQPEEHSSDEHNLAAGIISKKELDKGRLSRDEMERMAVFKNYKPGTPTCRLYVKNIAKQVEEKDLKYIYGRYINLLSEAEKNMFDIVLMKEGRMKGQAFIGLPNEQAAEKALWETNGFVVYDKPLVVQFARSARPKQDDTNTKKSSDQR